ncbi:MAG: IS66 family transposase [bacterium]
MTIRCRECPDCFRHLRRASALEARNKQLADENRRLKKQIARLRRSPNEPPFGASTPSSKIPVKSSSPEERRAKKGGRAKGHPGRGRKTFGEEGAGQLEYAGLESDICPDCGAPMSTHFETRTRDYVELERHRLVNVHCELETRRCTRCGARVTAKPKGVLPGHKFANSLLARLAVAHYLDNQTFGFLERHLGVAKGAAIRALHRMAEMLGPLHPLIIEAIRKADVLFADETGHRSDGVNGYVWAAFADIGEAFLVRKSRAGAVALEMFGDERLFGVMGTDRYGGYNGVKILRQFCFEHLKRDVKKIAADNPKSPEAAHFSETLAPKLVEAIKLRNLPITDLEYSKRSRDLRDEIMEICRRTARNPDIRKMQDLFRTKSANLFNWVDNRAVPADNNRAERGLRPVVISRKVSFGTQSDKGMTTMEVMLTVLRTLQLRTGNAETALKRILDELARNPRADVCALLPPAKPAHPTHSQSAA